MPVDTTVAVGDTAVLKCNPPKGNPRPVVRWLKNNVYIDEFSYPSAIAAASLTSDDEEEQSRRLDESGRLLVSFLPFTQVLCDQKLCLFNFIKDYNMDHWGLIFNKYAQFCANILLDMLGLAFVT